MSSNKCKSCRGTGITVTDDETTQLLNISAAGVSFLFRDGTKKIPWLVPISDLKLKPMEECQKNNRWIVISDKYLGAIHVTKDDYKVVERILEGFQPFQNKVE